jgi:hypothetical protein
MGPLDLLASLPMGARYRLAAILTACWVSAASGLEVAITIDDLPRGGDGSDRSLAAVLAMTEKLLLPFRKEGIPVIGFVNEGHWVRAAMQP